MAPIPSTDPEREEELARLYKLLEELAQIPALEPGDERADERVQPVWEAIRSLFPPAYQWTTRDDEIAEDAIMVGIGGSSAEMIAAGMSYVEPTASIYWMSRVTSKGVFEAGGEMDPRSAPEALSLAEALCDQMGYLRVVVLLQERGLWRDTWGTLAEKEGLS